MVSKRQRFPRRTNAHPIDWTWKDVDGVRTAVHADACICRDCEAKREARHWEIVGGLLDHCPKSQSGEHEWFVDRSLGGDGAERCRKCGAEPYRHE